MRLTTHSGVTVAEPTSRAELTAPVDLAGWDIARTPFRQQRAELLEAVTDLRVLRVALFLATDQAVRAEIRRVHRGLEERMHRARVLGAQGAGGGP